jgi:hypothetical protein
MTRVDRWTRRSLRVRRWLGGQRKLRMGDRNRSMPGKPADTIVSMVARATLSAWSVASLVNVVVLIPVASLVDRYVTL